MVGTRALKAGCFLAALSLLAIPGPGGARAGEASAKPLVVHEWGTFTCLQDEAGAELSGINIDDEPVPEFVHNLSPLVLSQPFLSSHHWAYRMKGAPRQHPRVTMRLETPVLYFHPPAGLESPLAVDVRVAFRGGWLTEFYPKADAKAPGIKDGFRVDALTPATVGTLEWRDVKVGARGSPPETDWPVWLAPRRVEAADVVAASGESERYLFYRGVGHLRAPLSVRLDRPAGTIEVRANLGDVLAAGERAAIAAPWLLDVRADGAAAFRTLRPLEADGDPARLLEAASYRFEEEAYSARNIEKLKASMHEALVADGLHADEATALLETWSRAYFTSPGLRLFFLVPRRWTDARLPLEVRASLEVRTERVMVGRIELISDRQRKLLGELAAAPSSTGAWIDAIPASDAKERFLAGRSDHGDLGVAIPADYQLYLDLGRFRNALVVAEERRQPSTAITRFIETYALAPFRDGKPGATIETARGR